MSNKIFVPIPISERLPEYDKCLTFIHKDGDHVFGFLNKDDRGSNFVDGGYLYPIIRFTHWLEEQDAPKDDSIEFAEWLGEKNFILHPEYMVWYKSYGHYECFTSQELYEQFKNRNK